MVLHRFRRWPPTRKFAISSQWLIKNAQPRVGTTCACSSLWRGTARCRRRRGRCGSITRRWRGGSRASRRPWVDCCSSAAPRAIGRRRRGGPSRPSGAHRRCSVGDRKRRRLAGLGGTVRISAAPSFVESFLAERLAAWGGRRPRRRARARRRDRGAKPGAAGNRHRAAADAAARQRACLPPRRNGRLRRLRDAEPARAPFERRHAAFRRLRRGEYAIARGALARPRLSCRGDRIPLQHALGTGGRRARRRRRRAVAALPRRRRSRPRPAAAASRATLARRRISSFPTAGSFCQITCRVTARSMLRHILPR